ncbi:MAG: hypothetical protein JW885_02740 [Deltaproteobacteria bacterium]|nr:hypothetical protein [Candidatus Zymogenaceae bacterium]
MKGWIAWIVVGVVLTVGIAVAGFFLFRRDLSRPEIPGHTVYNVIDDAFYEHYQPPEAGHEDDYINHLVDELYRDSGVYAGDGIR